MTPNLGMRLIHGWCGLKTVRESHDCLSWRDVLLTSKRSKASALCCGKSKQLQNKPLFGGEKHCKAVCLGPGVRGSSVCSGNCYFSLRFNDHFPGEPALAEFIGAKDHGSGDEIRRAKLQSNRHHQTNQDPTCLQAGYPSWHPPRCQSTERKLRH